MAGRPWAEEDIQFLREAAEKMTIAQVAEHLGRTHYSVKSQASKYKIPFTFKGYSDGTVRRHWTKSEITALMGFAETCSIKRAAARLGRSYPSVVNKIDELGISFKHNRLQLNDVADILGVSSKTVANRRNKLGLKFRSITGKSSSFTKGATGADIVAIANDILVDPPLKDLKNTSAKKLRQVIEDYEGWE